MLGASSRQPRNHFWLIWVEAKDRANGNIVGGGLWTGGLAETFIINGQQRVYQGGGNVLSMESIAYSAGVSNIQSQTIELMGMSPEVELLLRGYEPRQAYVEIHKLTRMPARTNGGKLESAFYGHIDELSFSREAADEEGVIATKCTASLMSASRRGTKVLHLKKSDSSQRLVNANDGGRKYSASKAKVNWMGEVKNPFRADQPR